MLFSILQSRKLVIPKLKKSEKLHVFKKFFKCFTLLKFTTYETMINILFLKLKYELSKKSLD